MKKIVSLLAALTLLLSCLGAVSFAEGAKYSVETTKDGWIKVVNEGGATLGYSPDSGVTLLEVDGYAFKDLNKNGELDVYEDWRLDATERARDLAGQMDDYSKLMYLMLHPSLGGIEADGSAATIGQVPATALYDKGLRSALNGSVGRFPAKALATYNNVTQAYVEALDWGIPFGFSSNPNTLGYARSLAMASTFDIDFVFNIYKEQAKYYRAIGVSTLLGPQLDLTSEPRWNRTRDTFGEDPALSAAMANAAISALQSTWDENGNDLGWGEDSVATTVKHWPGDGSGESGRESHAASGKYTVYPGDGFETILIPFVKGAFNLTSSTGIASGIMTSYSIAYSDDEKYGALVASPYSEFKIQLARSYNPDAMMVSDWGSLTSKGYGIDTESVSVGQRFAMMILTDMDQVGGETEADFDMAWAYLVEKLGEENALARLQKSAYRITLPMFRVGLFDNPYTDTAKAIKIENSAEAAALKAKSQTAGIIMAKNANDVIHEAEETAEKKTVYIPMMWNDGVGATPMDNSEPHWYLPVDLAETNKTYNVITDTIAEPSGTDKDGKPAYTEADIIRAAAEEIATADMAIIFTGGPKNAGSEGKGYGHDNNTDEYFPISLQYGEYVADSDVVREASISGDTIIETVNDLYAEINIAKKENRGYYDEEPRITNRSDLDAILYAAENAPDDAPVIVAINAIRPTIVSEFEEKVDAILFGWSVDNARFIDIITGQVEPTALLPLQIPADMETVEAQLEDVPRDMTVHTDAEGNAYDFGFGLNWSGVIKDTRTETYKVDVLTGLE